MNIDRATGFENATPGQGAQLPAVSQLGADLLRISPFQRTCSLASPFAWFGAYFLFAWLGLWSLAVVATVVLSFITYGSVSHDLVHRNLGLPRRANDLWLSLIELLAVRSGHAYQAAHLHHHARFPHEDDVEGAAARMSLPRALLEGVVFQFRVYRWSLGHAGRKQTWITSELALCTAIVLVSILSCPLTRAPAVYVGLMIMGTWIIPLITVYIPHNPAGADVLHQTRAFRGVLASTIAARHLYHLEHHLYPGVPHHHWPMLAKRLDPHLKSAGIRPITIWF